MLEGVVDVDEPNFDVGVAVWWLAEEAGDLAPFARRTLFQDDLPADLSYVDIFFA